MRYITFLFFFLLLRTSTGFLSKLQGLKALSVKEDSKPVELLPLIDTFKNKGGTFIIFGTYAADFNMIEYAQRIRFYMPQLKEKGISNYIMIVNGSPDACRKLATLVGLPDEIITLSDSSGQIGRAFGVSRGWRPDDLTNPYLKLFGMLWGLGAYATLPSVIGGYLGNPW